MTALVQSLQSLATPFDAGMAMCPKCNQPLRRITANSGSFFMTCPNRIPSTQKPGARPGEKRSDHCGQKVHVLAGEGVALVTPISSAQFEEFTRIYASARHVYASLGIIATRPASPDEIPEFRCTGCGEVTKLYDLYAGVCRRCSHPTEQPGP